MLVLLFFDPRWHWQFPREVKINVKTVKTLIFVNIPAVLLRKQNGVATLD